MDTTKFFSIRVGVEKYIDHIKECHIQYLINSVKNPTFGSGFSLGSTIINRHQDYKVDTKFDKDSGIVKIFVKTPKIDTTIVHSVVVTRDGDKWKRGDILDAFENEKVGNIFLRDFSRAGFAGVA